MHIALIRVSWDLHAVQQRLPTRGRERTGFGEIRMSASRPFSSLAVSSEIILLRRLHGVLAFDPIETKEQFGDLMQTAFDHRRLEPRRLADGLGFSVSTVYRWIEGRTAPHPSLWPTIVNWIKKAIEERLNGVLVEAETAT